MSRPALVGGKRTRGSKEKPAKASRDSVAREDDDAVDFDAIDWEAVEPLAIELDPALVEQMRSRRSLRQISLRVGVEQIAEARRVAAKTGLKYQAVLRGWLAAGASVARSKRLRARSAKPGDRRG